MKYYSHNQMKEVDKEFTPEVIKELKSFLVERTVDNMSTEDLVAYVTADLDQYFKNMPEIEFLDNAQNYWDDSFDDVVEEIEEYTNCDFKKDRRAEGKNVREQLLNEGFVPYDTDDTNIGGNY